MVQIAAAWLPQPFRPAPGLANPHLQSVLGRALRPAGGIRFRRRRLETPDGDFIDLDLADVDGLGWARQRDNAPVVLVLHGLEGSARSGYALSLYRELAARGLRPAGLNFRTCGGEMNRTWRMYHAGFTADVDLALRRLQDAFPGAPTAIVGFSLGANMTLKYLGELGRGSRATRPPAAAVAVSPPFDLAAGAEILVTRGRAYGRFFLRDLQAKLRQKQPLVADRVDVARGLAARDLREFDDVVTGPLNGFRDAADYYAQNSSAQFLPDVDVPTLILRALDDPFFGDDIPHPLLRRHPFIQAALPPHGGHVAFLESAAPWAPRFWAERQAARFLAAQLH